MEIGYLIILMYRKNALEGKENNDGIANYSTEVVGATRILPL